MGNRVLILASVASMIDQFNIPNIKLLKEMGYDVHVACNFIEGNTCSDEQITILKNNLSKANVEFHQIDFQRNVMRFKDNVKAYKQVHKLVDKYKFKFLHCHSPIGGVVGRLIGKTTNTKVIYTAHGFHFYEGAPLRNWLVYYPIERWLSKYTDILITINKEDYIRANKRFKSSRIEYIPGVGIDVTKFKKKMITDTDIRSELAIKKKDTIILSVGELNKNKNHETIIKAISKIKSKDVHYIICGQGMLEGYLLNLISNLELNEFVHMIGFRNDIINIYQSSDIFAFPSYREGLSVALMEATAAGLPVVCSKIRGNVDLIIEQENGFLVEPNNYEGFSLKFLELINNKSLSNNISRNNKLKSQSFDQMLIMEKMKGIYDSEEK